MEDNTVISFDFILFFLVIIVANLKWFLSLAKVDFIPKKSEMVIYDEDDTHPYKRIKIGDGVTKINVLPFATISEHELNVRLLEIQNQVF